MLRQSKISEAKGSRPTSTASRTRRAPLRHVGHGPRTQPGLVLAFPVLQASTDMSCRRGFVRWRASMAGGAVLCGRTLYVGHSHFWWVLLTPLGRHRGLDPRSPTPSGYTPSIISLHLIDNGQIWGKTSTLIVWQLNLKAL